MDKAPSLTCAFNQLKTEGYFDSTTHQTNKYLNNIIEQDHQSIKKRHTLYQSIRTASSTIKGIEVIYALYKSSRKEFKILVFSVTREINQLLGVST